MPGAGPPVFGSTSYVPEGMTNERTQTASSTIARTVKAVGKLRGLASVGVSSGRCGSGCSGMPGNL